MYRRVITVFLCSAAAAAVMTAPAAADPLLEWQPCPSQAQPTKQCAWLTVPRDYERPAAGTLQVAVSRIPATGPRRDRIGSLVWDAGGPGGPSTASIDGMVTRLSPQVRQRFDFVAVDPRGIGASRPALEECTMPWPVLPALDPLPSWRRAQQKSAAVLAQSNRRCLQQNRRIASALGTANVVEDVERLRAALGDRALTFWGTSYGTRIGYVYALKYPQRVRAMVMDGNIDPTTGYRGLARIGGLSQDSALRFIKSHDRPVYRTVIRTTASLTAEPIRLADGSRFTRWDWLNIVGDLVAFQDAWAQLPVLATLVSQGRSAGPEGDQARATLLRAKGRPNSNEGGAFSVVNCLDYSQRLTAEDQADLAAANARRAPITGGSLTLMYAMGCEGLDGLRPDPVPLVTTARQRASLAPVPVLLANATHDGSTPMVWAKRMQQVFDRPMIRYRSSQHVIWGATTSRCVNRPIDRFVLEVRLPKRSRTCDFVPSPGD
jgi:pimeloyl-ACP methyl ester carboxylesterase